MLWSTVEQTRPGCKPKTAIDAEPVVSRVTRSRSRRVAGMPGRAGRDYPGPLSPGRADRYPRAGSAAAWIAAWAGTARCAGIPGCAPAPTVPATATDAAIDPAVMRTTTVLVIARRPRRVRRSGRRPRAGVGAFSGRLPCCRPAALGRPGAGWASPAGRAAAVGRLATGECRTRGTWPAPTGPHVTHMGSRGTNAGSTSRP
jgi:hypothetical protein